MRVERVALEDHRDVAIAGLMLCHILAVDKHLAPIRLLEAGQDAQRRGLARSGWSEKREELPGLDIEIEGTQRRYRPVGLDDAPHAHPTETRHRRPPPLTAPIVRPLTM